MPDSYESETLLRQYLDFHYRSQEPDYLPHHPLPAGVVGYPERCAAKLIGHSEHFGSALDLGCAVGGSSFALAREFHQVLGIDFSASFIRAANQLAAKGQFRSSEHIYTPSSEPRKNPPRFQTGDACHLPDDLGSFDAVLMANLLCRLPDPAACLEQLKKITRPGSVLLFTTPCSWDEAFTPRDKWLWPTLEGLHQHLNPWCTNLEVLEMPFVLRDHERRAQFTVAQASVWKVS
ncbi:methyltransferase domain-containing protein [Kiritimatiellaeota bacterium B1221]|nr:methyltransferase domain-containing protein [Kiritimatiellaeota bacterium B1221]